MTHSSLRATTGMLAMLATMLVPLSNSPASAQEQPAAPEAGDQAQSLPAIVVTQAVERALVQRIVASGTVLAVDEVMVQPLVEGLSIRTLEADAGEVVEAGAVLARLNDDSLLLQKSQSAANRAKAEAALAQAQAQLTEAQANAADAQRQYRRLQSLSKNGTVSTAQVEQAETTAASSAARVVAAEKSIIAAEADIKVVDAQIADIELNLARTDVTTPVGGIIATRSARVGAIASGGGEPMFTLIRDGELELVADVSESDLLTLKAGQKATISIAGGAETLTGSVRLVSPAVDRTTRLGTVHISINEDERARTGMYGSGTIIVSEVNAVALPLSAITTDRNGTSTRLVTDGVVDQVQIETGIQDGRYIEVKSGVKAGDLVVAKAGAFVRDGDKINPIDEDATASN